MPRRSNLEYARRQNVEAALRIDYAKDRITLDDGDGESGIMMHINRANVISECQVGIELAIKAMFKAVGESPPKKHSIHFSDAEALLNVEEKTDFNRAGEIPRALFLTRFWREFYEEAKYGYPDQNVLPSDIFRNEDVKRAISDAEFCTELTTELIDCLEEDESENSTESI